MRGNSAAAFSSLRAESADAASGTVTAAVSETDIKRAIKRSKLMAPNSKKSALRQRDGSFSRSSLMAAPLEML